MVFIDLPSMMDMDPQALIGLASRLRARYGLDCLMRVYHIDTRRRSLEPLMRTLREADIE